VCRIRTQGNTDLIRTQHVLIEDLSGDFVNQRVGDPRTIMTVGDFPKLVCTDLVHCDLVCFFVAFDGNLSGHSTNGGDLASETHRQNFSSIFGFQALLVASLN
jgi:hypothetical protein